MTRNPPEKFCASPWIEGVLRLKGVFLPCCKNPYSLGNWREKSLREAWHSEGAARMRETIVRGEFPNNFCKVCWNNNTATDLRKLVNMPFQRHLNEVKRTHPVRARALEPLGMLFGERSMSIKARAVLGVYFKTLQWIDREEHSKGGEFPIAFRKLRVIGEIVEDFLSGNLMPRHVAPFRQPNIIAVCNARCIHCPGRYTGEIFKGLTYDGGTITGMSREDLDKALAEREGMIDFFMNGSELLFYREWERLAEVLGKEGIRVRVSTNTILLTEKNTRKLIDSKYIAKLNVSLDGASKETIERIRSNVKYDRMRKNLDFFFSYAQEQNYPMHVSFSFCLMKSNYQELPGFVDLVDEIRGGRDKLQATILVQPMSLKGPPEYEEFLKKEHHTLIDREALLSAFVEMRDRAAARDIPVTVFYSTPIDEFVAKDSPLPRYEFVATRRKASNQEL